MIDQIVSLTRSAIADAGIMNYLPALFLLERREVVVLEEVPDDLDQGRAVGEWLKKRQVEGESYLVAFRHDENHFRLMGVLGSEPVDAICSVADA